MVTWCERRFSDPIALTALEILREMAVGSGHFLILRSGFKICSSTVIYVTVGGIFSDRYFSEMIFYVLRLVDIVTLNLKSICFASVIFFSFIYQQLYLKISIVLCVHKAIGKILYRSDIQQQQQHAHALNVPKMLKTSYPDP